MFYSIIKNFSDVSTDIMIGEQWGGNKGTDNYGVKIGREAHPVLDDVAELKCVYLASLLFMMLFSDPCRQFFILIYSFSGSNTQSLGANAGLVLQPEGT